MQGSWTNVVFYDKPNHALAAVRARHLETFTGGQTATRSEELIVGVSSGCSDAEDGSSQFDTGTLTVFEDLELTRSYKVVAGEDGRQATIDFVLALR